MPWRGPDRPGAFPTLGHEVAEWIEEWCVVPDGEHAGEPFKLTDEMYRFVVWYYRLRPDAKPGGRPSQIWHYVRGGQLVRPQKWGKGPFSAAMICAEAEGPVQFDGWDADGDPVGRPWATPWVQVTAVSEGQTDNVYRALQPMIELGPLGQLIPDTGETRINLRGGGYIEPVTSSAKSRLGQRLTFAVQDETHSWLVANGGRLLADNQRRNLAGMGGRFLETSNAWNPAEQSVAQLTNTATAGVFVDYPTPPDGNVRNKRERRRVLKAVYGDSWWVDLDRIDAEIETLLEHDPAQAERFFLNRANAGESAAVTPAAWEKRAQVRAVPKGALIVLGVDGARFDDAVAVVATEVATGHQWPLTIIERPADADDDYEHDLEAIDGALVEAFATWSVWRAYIDPQKIGHLVDRWQGRWTNKVIVEWYTNRPKQIGYAVRSWVTAITAGDLSHDPDETFARHVANARRQPLNVRDDEGRPLWTMRKERPGSPNKIDASMAAVLAWEARGDAIAAGAQAMKPKSKTMRTR